MKEAALVFTAAEKYGRQSTALRKQYSKTARAALPLGLLWDFPPLHCQRPLRSFFHSRLCLRTRKRRLSKPASEGICAGSQPSTCSALVRSSY
ncbi:hypothetical protein V5799_033141 [Amblyomma americanum]|uniref:Uncharacterized protein n=1 Tax=Amblyomma americanum TaxID=6943 RepID=A0AAQ4DP61_AMBAM